MSGDQLSLLLLSGYPSLIASPSFFCWAVSMPAAAGFGELSASCISEESLGGAQQRPEESGNGLVRGKAL